MVCNELSYLVLGIHRRDLTCEANSAIDLPGEDQVRPMQRNSPGGPPPFSEPDEGNRIIDLRFTNQWKGIAQVVDDLGNLLYPCGDGEDSLPYDVSRLCFPLPRFVPFANT